MTNNVAGQYSIKGKVNLGPDWQPKVYMAAIKKLSDYYRTSPDMIVTTATVNNDGSFVLEGDNLPADKRFYRIYLMKKQNTDYDACLYVGGNDHNFAHVLLKNGETVDIIANPSSIAPFGEYEILGQKENQLMRSLAHIVFPSFYFYRIKFPTELKFSEDKLHNDLRQFADTCSNTLVALAAINSIDFDEYFDKDAVFYQQFGVKLKKELPESIYTKNYLLKLKYYANEYSPLPVWVNWLIGALSLVIMALIIGLILLYKKIKLLKIVPLTNIVSNEDLLTQKEREILQLIYDGESNKEIASKLFVELSTVKTHINKLYSKISVTSRKEAQLFASKYFKGKV